MKPIRAGIDVLSREEKQLIHEKSLVILEKTGLRAPWGPFLDLMEERGAVVDRDTQVMRIPPRIMENLLERDGGGGEEPDWVVSPVEGGISTEIFLVDYRTGLRRRGVMDDIYKGIALLDHLDQFPTADAVVIPSDQPEAVTDLESYRALYTYSRKPGGTYILTPRSAAYIIAMAKLLGREVSYGFQTVSPFQFTPETLEMAMLFREKGMDASVGPFVMAMGSAPITVAGALLTQNAEQLACLFINRALGDRGRGFYNATIHPMDPATLLCSFGSPYLGVSALAGNSMARYYGLPSGGNVGLTDSLGPDFQCGFEKGFSTLMSAFSGGRSVGGQGIVGADQGISLEQLVLDNEWISAFNASIAGIEVSEETLAEALIHELGIGGSFLEEEHTVEHMRDSYWFSRLFHREPWDGGLPYSRDSLLDKACEKVEEYTRGYQSMAPVLSPSQQEEMNRIADEGREYCLR